MELKGIPISPGLVHGQAHILRKFDLSLLKAHKYAVEDVNVEWERLLKAAETSRQQLERIEKRVEREFGTRTAAIFKTHLAILKDESLRRKIRKRLREEKINVEHVVATELEVLQEKFKHIRSAAEKDHIADITDVYERLLHNLFEVRHLHENPLKNLEKKVVIVAEKLIPSDTVTADRDKILAFVAEKGGRTSHVAILASSLGIPAVTGIEDVTSLVKEDEEVLVDGTHGVVYTHASRRAIGDFVMMEEKARIALEEAKRAVELPCRTREGVSIRLMANVGVERDIDEAVAERAEGIGLFRSEYLFMEKGRLATEEEQVEAYSNAAKRLFPYPVTVRTLDIGREKTLPYLEMEPGFYSALGVRGIRFSFHFPDIFRAQLRSILRSHLTSGNVRILFPMVATPSDVRKAKEMLRQVQEELARESSFSASRIKTGIMVEVPSVAVSMESFLSEVDFVTIGTNDLLQYVLAADRENERVAEYCEPRNPPFVRLLKQIVEASNRSNKEVSLCGEMASSPEFTELLLGVGLRILSLAPTQIPVIKEKIRSLRYETCVVKVQKALRARSVEEVKALFESV